MSDPATPIHIITGIIALASALANVIPPSGKPIPEILRAALRFAALNWHKNSNKD